MMEAQSRYLMKVIARLQADAQKREEEWAAYSKPLWAPEN
jgi:hypothetical protein